MTFIGHVLHTFLDYVIRLKILILSKTYESVLYFIPPEQNAYTVKRGFPFNNQPVLFGKSTFKDILEYTRETNTTMLSLDLNICALQ